MPITTCPILTDHFPAGTRRAQEAAPKVDHAVVTRWLAGCPELRLIDLVGLDLVQTA